MSVAIHAVIPDHSAQHHFEVFSKVAVYRNAICSLTEMHPVRFNVNGTVPLLQENDIRCYFCTGIRAESVIRQTDRSKEIRMLCNVFPYFRRLFIHGALGGDKGYHTTRAYLIQCLCKEVIVNQETILIELPVLKLIASERHIADGKIEEIFPIRFLKAGYRDICFGVKFPGNSSGYAVQFHAVQSAALHFFGQ